MMLPALLRDAEQVDVGGLTELPVGPDHDRNRVADGLCATTFRADGHM